MSEVLHSDVRGGLELELEAAKQRIAALQEALDDWAYQYPDKHLREQYKGLLEKALEGK